MNNGIKGIYLRCEQKGKQFDPLTVDAFLEILENPATD